MKTLIPAIAICLLILNPLGSLQAQVVSEGVQAAPSPKAVKKQKEPKSFVTSKIDHPVHLFILSGQSNMAGMDPETGFMTEATKLFGENQVGYIKVAKGGQPICRWLEEWDDIAEKKGLDAKHRARIHRDGKVEFYQPILDEYAKLLKKHPKPKSVTFCWMQGERDANGGAHAAYKDALKLLISKLRRDLKRPDMNIVIGRIGDYALGKPSPDAVRKVQREIADEDPRGAWVDVDDLNDKEVNGKIQSVVHFNRPDGYIMLGRRFARQGHALVTGKEPAENGRPGDRAPQEIEKKENKKENTQEKKKKSAIGAEAKSLKDSKPNIIIIMPDDAGYGDISCLGHPIIKTPNIDTLKKQSLLLTQYHVSPRCSPSRAKLMSGRHEFMSGVTDTQHPRQRMSLDTITVPQALKTAGYVTGMFGKWHLGTEEPYRPINRGFDEAMVYEKGARMTATIMHNGELRRLKAEYPTDLFFSSATAWMDVQRKAEKPFFVYLAPKSPHGPFKKGPSDMPNDDYKKFLGTHPKMTEEVAKVYWEIENIDRRVGEMINQLETWGIADNTLFIYIGSDNGNSRGHRIYNAGMKGHKGQPYQGGIRVPAFFRWPGGGIKGDSESAALTSQMDIMPTLLEVTGTPVTSRLKKQIEGRSLVPFFKDPNAEWEKRILVHHAGGWKRGDAAKSKHERVAIQNEQFTLVFNKELYDLKADPGETNNVIAEHPEIVETLRKAYDKWWGKVTPRMIHEDQYKEPETAPQETEKKENKKEEKQEKKKKSAKAAGPRWQVSTTEDWRAFVADADGVKIADGHAVAEKPRVSFTSQLKSFPAPTKLRDIELRQSVEWMNWRPYSLYQPNMKNAPVLISHGPNDHWVIAQHRSAEQLVEAHKEKVADAKKRNRKPPPPLGFSLEGFVPKEVTLEGYDEKLVTTPFPNQYRPSESKADLNHRPYQRAWKSGYHAWHSRDMVNWVHYGPTAAAPTVTTAEYVDGKTFFYYDRPNDRDPHLIIDSDLRDGIPGDDKGLAFDAPWGGSDVGVIRDLKGRFHMISENWQPIDASKRSWDSPLASHMVSEDGIKGFKILKPAVDYRTKPTGRKATFKHPHWNDEEKVVTYEIHEPKQDAFGDWAAIAIGGQCYLVSDYDPANAEAHGRSGMSVALFTSEDINKPFRFYGHIGSGHPDPDIMFADGKFYLITQTATDFVSDGPWIGTAKVRAGVDRDGDGRIDHWSKWQDTRETYSSISGFAKQVDRTPAKVSFSDLPAGKGFQIEVKVLSSEDHKSLPKLDQLIATFESSQK